MMAHEQIKMVYKSQAKEYGTLVTFHICFQFIMGSSEGQVGKQTFR